MNQNTLLTVSLLASLLLTACGGGSKGGSNPTTAPENLSYPALSAIYLLSVDAPANVPAVEGTVDTWSITPALPVGLSLNQTTGTISGRPEEVDSNQTYTVTATNAYGTDEFVLSIGVTPPPYLAFVANPEDDTISMYTVDAHTGDLHFNGYVATPAGEVMPETLAVRGDGRFLYVTNRGDGLNDPVLSYYEVNTTTGRLETKGSVATGTGPHSVVLSPVCGCAYVTAYGSDEVYTYSIDDADGSLTQVGTPITTGSGPGAITLDPLGRFAFVVNKLDSTVSVFSIDEIDGTLSAEGAAIAVQGMPVNITTDPLGTRVYVVEESEKRVSSFAIDQDSGDLTALSSQDTGNKPSAVSLHPTGRFAYVTNGNGDTLFVYTVDGDTGELAKTGTVTSARNPQSISFDPAGLYAYVVSRGDNEITIYDVDLGDGSLTRHGRIRTRSAPGQMAMSQGDGPLRRDAGYLYAASEDSGDVSSYSVNSTTGELIEVGTPVLAGIAPRDITLDPYARFAFVADTTGGILTVFHIDSDTGALTQAGAALVLPGKPRGVDVDPSGRYVYVATRDQDLISIYDLDKVTGELTLRATSTAGDNPWAVSIDPTGRFLYVTNALSDDITVFGVRDGEFVGTPTVATGPGTPLELRFSPRGDIAYAPLKDADHLVPYSIDTHDGSLEPIIPGRGTDNRPTSIFVHPSGRFAYAAINGYPTIDGYVEMYTIDPDTATMSKGTQYANGLNPRDLVVDPSGRFLYSANEGGDDLSFYTVNQDTGELTHKGQVLSGLAPRALAFTTVLRTVQTP